MAPASSRRLTPDDWLAAGAELLATRGADALKAEPMARRLATTKGSFYWHFRDVPDFHARLLSRWQKEATAPLSAAADGAGSAVTRLRELAQALACPAGGAASEAAIRAWAAGSAAARATVAQVDAMRCETLGALLGDIGISNPEMVQLIHATAIGMLFTGEAAQSEAEGTIGSLVDLVLALR